MVQWTTPGKSDPVRILNLPEVPDHIVSKIRLLSNTLAHDDERKYGRLWMNEFHGNSRSVRHEFSPIGDIDPALRLELLSFLSPYFQEEIYALMYVMRNVTNQPAWLHPHCDIGRKTAINYYIDLGGDHVETVFYDHFRITEPNLPENQRDEELVRTASFQHRARTWYCYNSQQCHSATNIETTRILLCICPINNPTIEEFLEKYQHLIVK